ncbi:MAG: hypothetical protein D3923_18085 [Candidatus Electrothrix sp. AR3]|nr:hypothetical protein [Candidatus Electrothrix sp. AR3]
MHSVRSLAKHSGNKRGQSKIKPFTDSAFNAPGLPGKRKSVNQGQTTKNNSRNPEQYDNSDYFRQE